MGKYDNIFNSQEVLEQSLEPEQAVAAIAVVTAIADSSLEDVDVEFLVDILWEFQLFEEYSDDQLLEMVDQLLSLAEEEGVGTLFNTAYECLPDELILDSFAVGVSVIIDEEKLTIPEKKNLLLKNLQEALEVEDEEAKEIIEEMFAALTEVEDKNEGKFQANFNQEIYESPLGNFTVVVPVNPQQGGRIDSQEGMVSFADDFDTLLRIDYYDLPSQQFEEIDALGQEEYLRSLLLNKYVPSAIAANVPDASVDYTEYLPDTLEGAYFALVNMPEGSTVSRTGNNGTALKLDAYRGLLAFIYRDFVYMISSQRSFFVGETPDFLESEVKNLKRKLFNFIDTITFI